MDITSVKSFFQATALRGVYFRSLGNYKMFSNDFHQTLAHARALRSIRWFPPTPKGDKFHHRDLTAQEQNAVPSIVSSLTYQIYQHSNAPLI